MQTTDSNIANAILNLTGTALDIHAKDVKGRNVWGRVAFNRDGSIHVQIMPKDKIVNDAVMPTITEQDMTPLVSSEEKYNLYRTRCNEMAKAMNDEIVEGNSLVLFIASNGYPTTTLKTLIEALL